ncbi:SA1320 family protein [Gemella cuniculi]|uniref:SA1320 family protein n=1 Tax=Gemella cuniculi TaxID=150240 RepID=UPI00040CBA31|nr:Mbeg1-like protein [Gemella cuniculi]
MNNSTLYASDLTYEFEKARIEEIDEILKRVSGKLKYTYPKNLEYLDDIYDKKTGTSGTAFREKDTGEIILAYTGTNQDTDKWNDVIKTDIGEIILEVDKKHYQPAYKFYEKIRAQYGNNIVLTGHSLGGNIAQRVALEYNVQKTIVYNSAPLYIFSGKLRKSTTKVTIDSLIEDRANDLKKWLFDLETERDKIKKLEKNFTGQVIRFQSAKDIVNNISDCVGGKYLGVEYVLKNSGWHSLDYFLDSEEVKSEIERITKQLLRQRVNIDINSDGKIDIELNNLDLRSKNLLGTLDQKMILGEKIKLNPDVLRRLSNNIKVDVITDLKIIKRITKLCIEKNNKINLDFEKRKKEVSENIKEQLQQAQIPQVLDNLSESIGEVIKNKVILSGLSEAAQLQMEKFSSNETPIVEGIILYPLQYNMQLIRLRKASEPLLNQCNREYTYDISSFFGGRPTILKSWQEVEYNTKRLLEESDKVFEGDGLRIGKEDGISQALKSVLEVANKNIEELEKVLLNITELVQGLAENFESQDSWLGNNIKNGVFMGSNPVRNMPTSYKAYLDRDEIFDDVKDVLQAFNRQVEKRSAEYSRKVSKLYEECLGNFEKGIGNWLQFINDFEREVTIIKNNCELTVEVETKCEEEYEENGKSKTRINTKRSYWGRFKQLYPENIVTNIQGAEEKIVSNKGKIEQTRETSIKTRDNLAGLEPILKKIIEEGIYKAFDLDEIVDGQKIVIQIIEKIQREILYVKEHIDEESMAGLAISALRGKIDEVEKSLEYYNTFIMDCFGNRK